ncbi:hypothetical protein [uncultured Aquimarina sp.]|uniref:hypothetical protein n=1 Tax=uncultured Aquimarina sp. TaxID=575652 RepID=UPI00262DD550|nr:hypothetical protein [uncultured Aquimarina sp.]
MEYQNDEVYLKQILSPAGDFFRYLIRLIYQSIRFYIKKAWLFLILIIVGIIGGYFLDGKLGTEIIKQEVIIEPKINSIRYIYNIIDAIPQRKNDEKYLESLGLQKEWIENIKTVKIEPILAIEDIFDYLHREYQDKNFQYTMQDFSQKEMTSDKFTYFYQYHVIKVFFNEEKSYNKLITETLLKSIYNNEHFKEEIELNIRQAKESVKNNKASLEFIDDYLAKVVEKSNLEHNNKELVIVSDETQTSKLASLLEQKSKIMNAIKSDEKSVNILNKVFSVVSNSDVVITKKALQKRIIIFLPILLCFIASIGYFVLFIFRQMGSFTKENL